VKGEVERIDRVDKGLIRGSWIIVVELLLLICTWEFNTKQKLTRKNRLLLFTGLNQYDMNKNG
jgi:hypothetical protein